MSLLHSLCKGFEACCCSLAAAGVLTTLCCLPAEHLRPGVEHSAEVSEGPMESADPRVVQQPASGEFSGWVLSGGPVVSTSLRLFLLAGRQHKHASRHVQGRQCVRTRHAAQSLPVCFTRAASLQHITMC